MPFGDSPSRRGIFDALVCGCIPILYHRHSMHYPWHVPNISLASLLVPAPSPWARPPSLLRHALRHLPHFFRSDDDGFGDGFGPDAVGFDGTDPLGRSTANAFARTLDAVRARSTSAVAAHRAYIIDVLLPRIVYHYSNPDMEDALTIALRRMKERSRRFLIQSQPFLSDTAGNTARICLPMIPTIMTHRISNGHGPRISKAPNAHNSVPLSSDI